METKGLGSCGILFVALKQVYWLQMNTIVGRISLNGLRGTVHFQLAPFPFNPFLRGDNYATIMIIVINICMISIETLLLFLSVPLAAMIENIWAEMNWLSYRLGMQ